MCLVMGGTDGESIRVQQYKWVSNFISHRKSGSKWSSSKLKVMYVIP